MSSKKIIINFFRITAACFLITYVLGKFFVVTYVASSSMEDTLNVGDILVATKNTNNISRGDIVLFKQDDNIVVKRVIGIGGDTVVIKNNTIYINGEELSESYIKESYETEDQTFTVPRGEYFVLGDNRNDSYDSRYWDYPYVTEVLGKVFWVNYKIIN